MKKNGECAARRMCSYCGACIKVAWPESTSMARWHCSSSFRPLWETEKAIWHSTFLLEKRKLSKWKGVDSSNSNTDTESGTMQKHWTHQKTKNKKRMPLSAISHAGETSGGIFSRNAITVSPVIHIHMKAASVFLFLFSFHITCLVCATMAVKCSVHLEQQNSPATELPCCAGCFSH